MLENYETIIWDWNGTLLNDIDLCVDISNIALKRQGIQALDILSYKNAFGFPITQYYERIGLDLEKESMEFLTKNFIAEYGSKIRDCNLHLNAKKVLQNLKQKEKSQFILTAAHKEDVLVLLDHFEIKNYFKEIEGLDNHRAESKVDKGISLMKNNNISPYKTVLIGDTDHDYDVACEMGIDCILISNGHQSKERLINAIEEEEFVLDHIGQLLGDTFNL